MASAQTTLYGGRGLLRTHAAETIGRSHFYVNSYFQTFVLPEEDQNALRKDHTLSVSVTLGLTRHLEFTGVLTPYQDDQRNIWGPPGDTQIGLKFISPFSSSSVVTGLRFFFRFPTAQNHNVRFEPYSSGSTGAGLVGLATFDFTDTFPLFPLKLHLNFGYMDHDLSDDPFHSEKDQYILAAGMKFPIRSTILFTEYTAEIFANNPIVDRYSLNSQRITQGIKFLGPWNLIMDLAVDFSLAAKPDPVMPPYLKEYAGWKVVFGVNYLMQWQRRQRTSLQDGRRSVDPEAEADRMRDIREKRMSAEEEMRKMQESLSEEEKKKKSKDNENNENNWPQWDFRDEL